MCCSAAVHFVLQVTASEWTYTHHTLCAYAYACVWVCVLFLWNEYTDSFKRQTVYVENLRNSFHWALNWNSWNKLLYSNQTEFCWTRKKWVAFVLNSKTCLYALFYSFFCWWNLMECILKFSMFGYRNNTIKDNWKIDKEIRALTSAITAEYYCNTYIPSSERVWSSIVGWRLDPLNCSIV